MLDGKMNSEPTGQGVLEAHVWVEVIDWANEAELLFCPFFVFVVFIIFIIFIISCLRLFCFFTETSALVET
jgi:hypothetical protein